MTYYFNLFGKCLSVQGAEPIFHAYAGQSSGPKKTDFALRLSSGQPFAQLPVGAVRTFYQPGWPAHYQFGNSRFYVSKNVCLRVETNQAEITYLIEDDYLAWLAKQVVRYFAKIAALENDFVYLPVLLFESPSRSLIVAGRQGGGRHTFLNRAEKKNIRAFSGTTIVEPHSSALHWLPFGGACAYKEIEGLNQENIQPERTPPVDSLVMVNRWVAEESALQSLSPETAVDFLHELNRREYELFTSRQLRTLKLLCRKWIRSVRVQKLCLGTSDKSLDGAIGQLCGVRP
ncbi:MAG: hypothetical protein R3B54_06315 [Bdellovibrionota bacterium]